MTFLCAFKNNPAVKFKFDSWMVGSAKEAAERFVKEFIDTQSQLPKSIQVTVESNDGSGSYGGVKTEIFTVMITMEVKTRAL